MYPGLGIFSPDDAGDETGPLGQATQAHPLEGLSRATGRESSVKDIAQGEAASEMVPMPVCLLHLSYQALRAAGSSIHISPQLTFSL